MSEIASNDFASCINPRAEISMFSAVVVSFNIKSSPRGLFSDDLDTTFFQVGGFNSSFSVTVVGKTKTDYPEFISKVCNIDRSLAYKSLNQST